MSTVIRNLDGRVGKAFDCGTPSITSDLCAVLGRDFKGTYVDGVSLYRLHYMRPWNNAIIEEKFADTVGRKDIAAFLVVKANEFVKELGIQPESTCCSWVDDANYKAVKINIGRDTAISFGNYFPEISRLHNMHVFSNIKDTIVGFKLSAELVEKLDTGIIAPNIFAENNDHYTIEYPLPKGHTALKIDSREEFEEMFGLMRRGLNALGRLLRSDIGGEEQSFSLGFDNKITISGGLCKATGAHELVVPDMTVLMANLIDYDTGLFQNRISAWYKSKRT